MIWIPKYGVWDDVDVWDDTGIWRDYMIADHLDLDQCRDQVNIQDEDFLDDNLQLARLASAAEQYVENYIGRSLKSMEDDNGDLPRDLQLGILFLVATWYKNRENTIEGTITSRLPYAMEDILTDYKKR